MSSSQFMINGFQKKYQSKKYKAQGERFEKIVVSWQSSVGSCTAYAVG